MSTQPTEGQNVNRHPDNHRRGKGQGIRRKAMTESDVTAYALTMLGFPQVDVEVATESFSIFHERTLDEYNKWLPTYNWAVLTGFSGTHQAYNLEDLEFPYGREVVDCAIVAQSDYFSPIGGVFALGIPHPISHLSPDQYSIAVRYIQTARREYSAQPEWEWREPLLYVYAPGGYGGPYDIAYTYSMEADCYEDVQSENRGWCKDYFMNLVKYAVGEARGKFGQIPGPASAAVRGAQMAVEAHDRLRELERDLRSMSFGRTPPLFAV